MADVKEMKFFYGIYRCEALQTGISIRVRVFRKYGKVGLCKFSIYGIHINDVASAAKALGFHSQTGIYNCLSGLAKTAGGYIWKKD